MSQEKLEVVASRSNWENCETGEGICDRILITRSSLNQEVVFIAPCGGTATTLYLYANKQEKPIQVLSVGYDDCPPTLVFTGLKDGYYYASILSCGLGGTVQIKLETN